MAKQGYDIFLIHAPADEVPATLVRRALTDSGFSVVRQESGTAHVWDSVIEQLVECVAVVAVITPTSESSSNLWLEIGAAMSWLKPIYFVTDGLKSKPARIPVDHAGVFPISRISALVDELRGQIKPLSDQDRQALKEVYLKFQVPTDQLRSNPNQLETLADEFKRIRGVKISGERLLQEMMRLRKKGEWPRIGKAAHAIPA